MNTLLDHQIAEALGYTIYAKQHKLGGDFLGDLPVIQDEVRYYQKDGEFLDITKFSPSTKVEEAIDLLDGLEWEIGFHTEPKQHYCMIMIQNLEESYLEKADTLPEAICKAFLAWKKVI